MKISFNCYWNWWVIEFSFVEYSITFYFQMEKFKALPHSCVYEYTDKISGNSYMIVIGRSNEIWWGEAFKNGSSVSCLCRASFCDAFDTLVENALEA